jgi:hypothetical protein
MTPKRLRLIAQIIRNGPVNDAGSRDAIALELDTHAEQIEYGQTVRLKEPGGTVFTDLERKTGKRS